MLDVTFYGVRGSTPCSSDDTRGYGGNTSCVLVDAAGNDPIILDCGTGLRYLGRDLEAVSDGVPFRGTALVSHLHWDHVQGLPFFVPILADGAELTVVGPAQSEGTFAGQIKSFIRPPLFPVDLELLPGTIEFREVSSGCFTIGSAKVTVAEILHLGRTNGYRIDNGTGSVAYLSDHQQPVNGSVEVPEPVVDLCAGVDLLIHDAQYDDVEFAAKSTWGHSTPTFAAEVARRAGAKRLVLFHHDPLHDDRWVDAAVERTQRAVGDDIEVIGASEGLSLRSGTPLAV